MWEAGNSSKTMYTVQLGQIHVVVMVIGHIEESNHGEPSGKVRVQ